MPTFEIEQVYLSGRNIFCLKSSPTLIYEYNIKIHSV